jgi:hypothetical protein
MNGDVAVYDCIVLIESVHRIVGTEIVGMRDAWQLAHHAPMAAAAVAHNGLLRLTAGLMMFLAWTSQLTVPLDWLSVTATM